MTRSIHDQFAKKCLTEILTPLGEVKSSVDITAEVRQADLLFLRDKNAPKNLPEIGLMGRLAATSALSYPVATQSVEKKFAVVLANYWIPMLNWKGKRDEKRKP